MLPAFMLAGWLLLIAYVVGALGISFLCSLLEAVLLSSAEPSLLRRRDKGDKGAERLLRFKQERLDDALSSILILNTIAHTIGAALAGAQAAQLWGNAMVGVFSAVLTLLVLVLSEIIPKTLGTVYAERLTNMAGRTIVVFTRVLAPVLALTRLLTRRVNDDDRNTISQRDVAALITAAARQGALKKDISEALSNLLRFEQIRVEDIMTPRTVAWMLPSDATIGDLVRDPMSQTFSRVPIFEGTRDHIVGYVLVREPLAAAAKGAPLDKPIRRYLRRIRFISERVTVGRALRSFLEWRVPLAMVGDEYGGVAGLVTIEDAIETILGQEILDELDRVGDLRALAAEARDRRMRAFESGRPRQEGTTLTRTDSIPPAPQLPSETAK